MQTLIARAQAAATLPTPDVARTIRQMAGVSRVDLAHELGIHHTTLWRWESGERRPQNLRERAAYASALRALKDAI